MSYTSGTTRGAGGDRLSTVFESSKVIQPELAREQVGVPTEDRVHADEFEQTYAEKIQQVTHAVVKQFLSFPSGDIGIVDLPRKFRTLSCSVPEEETKKEQALHVQDCILAFSKPLVTVQFNNRKYEAISRDFNLPTQNFCNPKAEDREIFSTINVDTQLLQTYSHEILKNDTLYRQQERFPILGLVPVKKHFEPADQRPTGTPDISFVDTRLSVTVKELTFGHDIEPFFISLTLYDLKERTPISETFYVYSSDPSFLNKLKGRPGPASPLSSGKTACFRISEASPDIHLIIRIEKVLLGDLESATSYYFKNNIKPKEKQKYVASMEATFQRLGCYTQSFAMAVLPLYKDNGGPLYGEVHRGVVLDRLARMSADLSDDTLYKSVKALLNEKQNKLKFYPGSIHLNIGTDAAPAAGTYTPTLIPLQPAAAPNSAPIREIQEFYTEKTGLQPQSEWVHHLYFYPIYVNMNNWSGKGSARNLSLEVSLKGGDDNADAPGENCIYGRAHQPNFLSSSITAVNYHSEKPYFHEEFKIRLPTKISPKHHILIKINHINVRSKAKKDKDVVSVVTSYANLRLLTQEGKLVPDGEHFVCAAYTHPSGYLSPEIEDSMKFVEKNRKPNILVRTLLVSTIQSQDELLNNFYVSYDQNISNADFIQAIVGLRGLSPHIATKWFPSLFISLLRIMATHNDHTCLAAFQSMAFIADSVSRLGSSKRVTMDLKHNDRNLVLVSWITYYLDVLPGKLVHEVLLQCWVQTLEQKNAEAVEMTCRHSWFFFDMIIKTMLLSLCNNGHLDNDHIPRAARFSNDVAVNLAKLSALMKETLPSLPNMAKTINENMALFFKDLLTLFDRGIVMELIYLYETNLPESQIQLKFDFLRIICDYEHYVQLNFPIPDVIQDATNLEKRLWGNHFLSGLVVDEVVKQIEKQNWNNIAIAVDVLFNLAQKHVFDARYQHVLAQKCIPGIYFSLVIRLVDANSNDHRCITEAPMEIRVKLLSIYTWIVYNVQRKLLQQWWGVDTQSRVISFFMILNAAIQTFEYKRKPSETEEIGLEILKEQNASREVTLMVLDILMDFMNDNATELKKPESVYMERIVIHILSSVLRCAQSESALIAVFAAVRHSVVMFCNAYFIDPTPFCGAITYGILRHCNSSSPVILGKATALFYLLIHDNYRRCGNFSRMKLQATSALSRLVGESAEIVPEQFQHSLSTVAEFAQQDKSMPDTFKTQVSELMNRLFSVLRSSKEKEEYAYDPEKTADLYYDISKGYIASPDLRATWLSNLAIYQESKQYYEEAAQCKIHLAALVSVYINKLKVKESVSVNPLQFKRAAPNSSDEMNVPPEAFEEEGICHSAEFTRNGMFTHLQEAVSLLKQDHLFESCIAVQRLIVDVHKENRNYAAMSSVFGDLQNLSNEILTSNASNSRLFSSFYLVSFFGQHFGNLDKAQFIYKERQHVRLADISNRLKEQYASKFGTCNTLASSANTETLDPNIPHIMVLAVKPYLTPEELTSKDRQSNFEKQFNIKRFIFETPMTTIPGKKYSDEITEQAKKKTIIETEYPFPFVIKRLRVISQTSEILSPIQTAIELIEDRCRVTLQEVESIPPNSKTLQIILQGSVLLQVNAGPLAIAKTFLGNRGAYPPEDIAKLEDCMRQFVTLCDRGVKLNKTLIGPDQREFHAHLQQGYEELYNAVQKLLPS